jgi:hypothetical protein
MSQRNAGNPSKYPSKYNAPTTTPAASAAPSAPAATVAEAFPVALAVKAVAWCVGWYFFIRIEFGSIYLIVSALIAIFTNLSSGDDSKSASKLSAYSVFNRGATRIAGSMDAESFDREVRHQPRASEALDLDLGDSEKKEHYQRKSKAANQPCVCGSGKKVSQSRTHHLRTHDVVT